MLQIFRDKAQSTFIQAIVLVIALVFIFWGVGTNMMGSREAAIVVNDEEISFQEYQQVYDKLLSDYRQQFGGSVPEELLQTLGLSQQVKNQLIQGALLRQGATSMGLMASAPEIQRRIQGMVQFQENNSFDLAKYQSILASNRLTPHKFEADIRHDMLSGKAITSIVDFSTIVADTEILDRFQEDKESLSLLFTTIRPLDFHDQVMVEEEKLLTWFDQNKEAYKTAPRIKLKFLSFPYDNELKNLTVSDEQIEKSYQENLARYQEPEKRHARHILLKADENSTAETHASQLAKAEEAKAKAKAGEDFAILAQTYSEGPTKANGGDLGKFSRGQMVEPFDDAVFSMQEGEISEIVKTRFGYHVILLQEILPATTRPLAEVREELTKELKNGLARPAVFQKANDAYEGIIAAGSLQEYARLTPDTTILETDFFSQSDFPEQLDKDPIVQDTAFSLKNGELSSLLESPNGYSVLYAEAIEEPTVPELDSIRKKVTEDYTAELARTLALGKSEELLSALISGSPFTEASKALGVEVKSATLLRNSTGSEANGFPPSLVQNAFTLSNDTPLPEKTATVGDDFFIYQFSERKLPDPAGLTTDEKERYRAEILRTKQDGLLIAWLRHQEKNAKIYSNKNL
ncbi:MAG: SurA N-terminal domain-containing protein [Proteobacteria bacterium]|nr:SurA N-terminal domain-containing protein [Pseudomonadota bacterium]MBU1058627.1 SurA N-terminal domain-containing protein [Pseudomonadota bacterium]